MNTPMPLSTIAQLEQLVSNLRRDLQISHRIAEKYRKALIAIRDFDDNSEFDDPGYIAINALKTKPPTRLP